MQPSPRDSTSERRSEQNPELITSQPEPRQLAEPGEGRRENECPRQSSDGYSERDQSSSSGSKEEEVDRPDLELNYQGNSLVIDLDPLEWIALVIITVIGAWLLHHP